MHAELDFGNGHLQLGEPSPDYGLIEAPGGDADCSIGLYCSDADAVVERAVAAGAPSGEPPADFVSGDRYAASATVRRALTVMTRVEDLTEEESAPSRGVGGLPGRLTPLPAIAWAVSPSDADGGRDGRGPAPARASG